MRRTEHLNGMFGRGFHLLDIWVFPKIVGNYPKWMVKIMEKPIFLMDDWGGKPPIFGNTHIKQMFQVTLW